jgi:hypothetical protein
MKEEDTLREQIEQAHMQAGKWWSRLKRALTALEKSKARETRLIKKLKALQAERKLRRSKRDTPKQEES